ncbi:MAG: acetylxylan esterase, partial [Saprospiraceae bacterium]
MIFFWGNTAQSQSVCQSPTVPPPPVDSTQLWAGADKTLYAVGETITFRIQSTVDGPCTYTIQEDRYLPILKTGTIDLVANVESTVTFVLDHPGFLMFTVHQGGPNVVAGIGVDACDIEPIAYWPDDFDRFWDSLKTELAAIPINPQITMNPDLSNEAQTTYKMVLDNIEGKKVYGWISIPNCPGPFGAILTLPSFGLGPIGASNFDAFDGIIGVSISIHDYDCEQFVPADLAYAPKDHFFNRHTNYYKAAILGCLRAIDYIFTRPEFDGVHMAVTGVSQGGALTLMAAGLDERVKYISQGVTALCNHAAFATGKSSGFPYWLREGLQMGGDETKLIEETGYYDAVHFARKYKGPSFNFVGYNDDICPPTSVFAAYNMMPGNKSMFHSINTGHANPPNYWPDRLAFWLSQGIPYSKFYAGCPPVPPADTIAPDSVQSFVISYAAKDSLVFTFKATGDDLNAGTAYRYDIRYSDAPLNEFNYSDATAVDVNFYPFSAGEDQAYVLSALDPGVTYYLGIKAIDEADNVGPLAVSQGTTVPTVDVQSPAFQRIRVYPNPTRSVLHVNHAEAVEDIKCYNMLGELVLTERVVSPDLSLDVSGMPVGV